MKNVKQSLQVLAFVLPCYLLIVWLAGAGVEFIVASAVVFPVGWFLSEALRSLYRRYRRGTAARRASR